MHVASALLATDITHLCGISAWTSRHCPPRTPFASNSSNRRLGKGPKQRGRHTAKQQALCKATPSSQQVQSGSQQQLRIVFKRILRQLSTLELAIGELAVIAGLSSVGTFIKQNEPVEFYVANYPEGSLPDFRLIWALQWDHIYTADYFLALLGLLAASLAACSYSRQWPMVKVARRWKFASKPERVYLSGAEDNTVVLPDASIRDFGLLLRQRGYQIFMDGGSMYAFKGLAGKLAPIGVHVSMLAIMAGVTVGGLGGLKGSVMVPEGGDFIVSQPLRPQSPFAGPSQALQQAQLHVNSFEVEYRPDGSVGQFLSDITVAEPGSRRPPLRKTISVNDPLRYEGMTAYQTDWSMAAVTLRVEGSALQAVDGSDTSQGLLNLPVASMEGQPGIKGKLWATFIPAEAPSAEGAAPRGVSLLMRDFQSVALYDTNGAFVGVRRPGSGKPIQVEGMSITVDKIVGSTGLELKVDPGIPYVYAGFAGLMLTTAISYLSHSQVWALQQQNALHISGKSNRATVGFAKELSNILDEVPDRGQQAQST